MFKSLLCVFIFCVSGQAMAKNMSSRLGFGYSDQFSSKELPSATVRYYSEADYGVSLAVAMDTEDNKSRYGGMVKAYKIIFPEDYLNFYIGGGLGFLSVESSNNTGSGTKTDSGVELTGFIGAEFFIPKLDNLGFSFEAGLGVSTVDKTRVRTIGDHPLRAGITFYL